MTTDVGTMECRRCATAVADGLGLEVGSRMARDMYRLCTTVGHLKIELGGPWGGALVGEVAHSVYETIARAVMPLWRAGLPVLIDIRTEMAYAAFHINGLLEGGHDEGFTTSSHELLLGPDNAPHVIDIRVDHEKRRVTATRQTLGPIPNLPLSLVLAGARASVPA